MSVSANKFVMQYIRDIGEGVIPRGASAEDWPVVAGPLPEDGSRYIGVLDIPAFDEGREMTTGGRNVHQKVQVIVRAEEYGVGMAKARQLQSKFDLVGNHIGGIGWVPVSTTNDLTGLVETITITALHVLVNVIPIGMEQDGRRFLFSIAQTQVEIR